jgi:hypothetical protein
MLVAATICRDFATTRQSRGKIFFPCAAILPRIYGDYFFSLRGNFTAHLRNHQLQFFRNHIR